MHMGTDPTQERPLNCRWPFKSMSFDEMLVDLASIMVNAARQPESSINFFCCNTESQGSRGSHWMSAVFEVIAPEIGRRGGQQAARSAQKNRTMRAMKRRRAGENKPVGPDCDLASSTNEKEGERGGEFS